jgi:RNA polymerase sigma-70 factor (ECF subfamily)
MPLVFSHTISAEELIQRFQRGDESAFDQLVVHLGPRIAPLISRMVTNPTDAQDATQEVFLNLYRALPTFKGQSAFFTFFYRLTLNVCVNFNKRLTRRPTLFAELDAPDADGPGFLDGLPAADNTERTIGQQTTQRALHTAIATLPPQYRDTFVMHYMQDLPLQTIAATMDVPEGTVKSRLNRARKLMQEKILAQRELFAPSD